MSTSSTTSMSSPTSAFMINKEATVSDFETARNAIYKLGIKSSYDTNRMIFSTLHTHKNKLSSAYAQECNGLILELGSWRPLVVPPRSLRFNINTNLSNKFLHRGLYNIYNAEDGTCINLYYYNNKWCISTARGYEMNDLKWESKTYQELITECLATINLTFETFTAALDTNHCYSFGFKHKDFHRFIPVNRMWFIQSVNLDAESDSYMTVSYTTPVEAIVNQTLHIGDVSALKDLYRIAANSLDTYIENKDLPPCFGFILRSVNTDVTGAHSDLFIESSLMRQIRQIWYGNQMNKECVSNQWSKEIAVTLNAYLDGNMHENFLHLFPQYQDNFNYYNILIQVLVTQMLDVNAAPDLSKLKAIGATANPGLISSMASNMLDNFNTNMQYDLSGKTIEEKTRVLTEFMTHPYSLNILMVVIS